MRANGLAQGTYCNYLDFVLVSTQDNADKPPGARREKPRARARAGSEACKISANGDSIMYTYGTESQETCPIPFYPSTHPGRLARAGYSKHALRVSTHSRT